MRRPSRTVVPLLLLGLLAGCGGAEEPPGPPSCTPEEGVGSVEQYGVTWVFDRCARSGRYANGDFWVVGPVSIVRITPDADARRVARGPGICDGWSAGAQACEEACRSAGADYAARCGDDGRNGDCNCDHVRNGWEVNPLPGGGQGLDERAGGADVDLVPTLPYLASPGESLLKVVSAEEPAEPGTSYGILTTAAVLTVVAEPPPDGGATTFRPPYVGPDKPQYATTALHTELLPALAPVDAAPTLAEVEARFVRVQLDHEGGATGRYLHPVENIPDYGSDIALRNNDAALRLALDDPLADRLPALIAYVQYGIDLYAMVRHGQTWPDGGGHRPGQKLPLTFAAVLLDDAGMRDAIRAADFFHEDRGTFRGAGDAALFGFPEELDERAYWNTVIDDSGFRSRPDPYGYVDGGRRPGGGYQYCCISQPWRGTVLAMRLWPALQDVWTNPLLFDYVDRWVAAGAWSQPDPCAPPDGVCAGGDHAGDPCTSANEATVCTGEDAVCDLTVHYDPDGTEGLENHYGVTYGPDGAGGCILDTDPADGTGRFPQFHGTEVDGGYRGSDFQRALWAAHP